VIKPVKVYGTPTCPYCIRAKQFLKENNINFENIDVSLDREAADEMVRRTGQMGVPVLEIGTEIIIGFDEDKIKEALGI
jgi:glutaredoxin-like YruB-family protein